MQVQRGLEGFPGMHFAFSSVLFIIWCCKKRMPCNSFGCVASCFVFTAWKGNVFFVHFLVMSVVSLIIRVIISQRYSYCIIHLLFPPVSVLTKNWRLSACFIQVIYHLFTCYCSLIYECIFFLLIRIFVGYLFCIVLHLWCIWPFIRISIIYVPWTVLHLCMYLFTHSHFNYLFALNCSSYMLVIFVYSFAF